MNDRIFELEQEHGTPSASPWARCECGRRECEATLAVSEAEYVETRAVPTRFLVVRGHEFVEFERIVAEHDAFVVVEAFGRAAHIAATRAA